jgi:septal ring factor EnvC (AmiA/AmiB activator)
VSSAPFVVVTGRVRLEDIRITSKNSGKRPQLSPEREEEYQKQIAQLQMQVHGRQSRNEELCKQLKRANAEIQELREKNQALRAAMDTQHAVTQQVVETQRMQILEQHRVQFDRSYSYTRRERVVELTQFICKYLENKPWEVDANRIFHCIQNLSEDLRQRYPDNPVHFHTDVRMLLHVCLASKWFSDEQLGSLMSWCQQHGWKM